MHDTNGRRVRSTVTCTANNNGTKLKRCASLPAQKRNVPYMSSKETENLKLQLESSVESLGEYYVVLCFRIAGRLGGGLLKKEHAFTIIGD